MKSFLFISASVCVAATTFLCFGQSADLRRRFDAYDTNKDGLISGDEMNAAPILKRLDLDGSGSLTLEEAAKNLSAGLKTEAKSDVGSEDRSLFDRLDEDGDGVLKVEELPRKQWFDRLDGDKDRKVTFQEAAAVMLAMRQRGESIPRLPKAAPPAEPATSAPVEKAEAPDVLKGSEVGVGRLVADFTMNGEKLSARLAGSKGIILAFFGATCPISGKLGPELARLEKDAQARGIKMQLVCPVAVETTDDIQKFISTHELKSPVAHDKDGVITAALAASTTTEVFLLDASRTLVYRGAVNDQYGLGYAKEAPTQTYLRHAITAMLAHTAPEIAATSAPGCALDLKKDTPVAQTAVTYHHQIARIMQGNCVECHRAGGVGPFSLTSYEDVIENAGMIRKQVERGAMPPWFAATPPEGTHSPWINDASLSKQEKADLLTWLASDRPKGDASDAPLPRKFPDEWIIGQPDAIVQLPEPISIKAEGTMPYQFVTATTDFPEDRWVQGYEILPTDASVVHHVIVQVHKKGTKARDRGEGAEGYWAAYVPGNTHHVWPEHFAKKLPAGATVSFQIHYTPNGKKTQDQLRMGLIFAKAPPRFIVHTASVANPRLNIPAGAANHLEVKEQGVPFDMHVMSYMAHMHVRGKAFKFEVTPPDGSPEVLLDIPRYDFNWQLRYDYAQPRLLQRGSKVKITAIYDNSAENPANPDPTKVIRWGQQTFDEMMIGYLEYYTPNTGDVAME
jgi:mono/diheme cytochrome c family protein